MTGGAQDSGVVSRQDALDFLGDACRNWQHIAPISEDDVADVAGALQRFVKKRATPAPEPKCFECGDSGEVYTHADDCDNDNCALNGDIDSCLGKVEPCSCATPAPAGWQTDMSLAPKDGTQILVEVAKGCFNVVSFWALDWRESVNGMALRNAPLRWAAIPTAPAEGGDHG